MTPPRIVRPNLVQQLEAFRLPDQILSQLATGEIDAVRGVPVFRDRASADHTWYSVPAALDGWLQLWRLLILHYRLQITLRPVEMIAQRLDVDAPITPDEVAAAQRTVAACRKAYRSMDIYTVGALRNAAIASMRASDEARRDAWMLEHTPEAMTPAQQANWVRHQAASDTQ